jgi:hypothetical protein
VFLREDVSAWYVSGLRLSTGLPKALPMTPVPLETDGT